MTATLQRTTRTCRWCLPTEAVLYNLHSGASCDLEVTVGSERDIYEVRRTTGGWRIGKVGGASYLLPLSLDRCNCPWGTKKPGSKPCRHRAALRAALAAIRYWDNS